MIIFARAPGATGWVEIKPEEELSHRGQFWEIRKFSVEQEDAMPLARRLERAEQALRAAGFAYHGPTEKWLAPKIMTAVEIENDLLALLPGNCYLDEPDGGSVTVAEQFRRMAADAAKWRALSEDEEISRHAFEDWWEAFKNEHDEWEYADSSALRWAAWRASRAGAE